MALPQWTMVPRPSGEGLAAVPVEIAPDDHAQDLGGASTGQEESRIPEIALHRILHREAVGGEDPRRLVGDLHRRGGADLRLLRPRDGVSGAALFPGCAIPPARWRHLRDLARDHRARSRLGPRPGLRLRAEGPSSTEGEPCNRADAISRTSR